MLNNTYALVVCGGESSRMGADKSLLTYYKKPQRYHLYDILKPLCEKVFISCKAAQQTTMEEGYFTITDFPAYSEIGPMAALLSAFSLYPGKDILLIGCDYPFLTESDINNFINYCEGKNNAVSFCNKADIYEPLLAWYPNQLSGTIKNKFLERQYSLQHFLKFCNAIKYYPDNADSMVSIDTKEQYIKALKEIKHEQTG